jgi:hypothetical protein
MSYDRGPRFAPAESGDPERRIRRIEDWAGRHDQWAAQTAVGIRARAAEVEERVGALVGKSPIQSLLSAAVARCGTRTCRAEDLSHRTPAHSRRPPLLDPPPS